MAADINFRVSRHRLSRLAEAMDMLYDAYRNSNEYGVNHCEQISHDKRCIIDESMTLHQSPPLLMRMPSEDSGVVPIPKPIAGAALVHNGVINESTYPTDLPPKSQRMSTQKAWAFSAKNAAWCFMLCFTFLSTFAASFKGQRSFTKRTHRARTSGGLQRLTMLLMLMTYGTLGSSSSSGGCIDGASSCLYANDGECDEPQYCSVGTDTNDCSSSSGSSGSSGGTDSSSSSSSTGGSSSGYIHLMPVTVAVLRMAKGVRMRAFAIWIMHVIHALVRVLMSAALMIL